MEALLEKWGRFVARWPILIIAVWIIAVVVALATGPSLDAVATKQNNTSSLPASAPSSKADHLYTTQFTQGQQTRGKETDLIVLTNPQRLTSEDEDLARQVKSWLLSPQRHFLQLVSVLGPDQQTPAKIFESNDQQALRMSVVWNTTGGAVDTGTIQSIENYLTHQHLASGGTFALTGGSPITADLSSSIFSNESGGLNPGLIIGLLIILVVLGAVYRSPLAVIVPFIAIGLALALAVPLISWMGQIFGIPVASFDLEYVGFVLLGAGTNYGVFMLSRYKEEIRRGNVNNREGRRVALGRTIGHVGEAILSSATTVIVATSIMGFAQLYQLRVTGPAIAVGVACLLLAGISLLPALMAVCGKALFWPVQPHAGTVTAENIVTKGIWSRAGQLVTTHPLLVVILSLVILLPLSISTAWITLSFDELKSLPTTSQAVQAVAEYRAHFQDANQMPVFLSAPGHDLRQTQYRQALAQVASGLSRLQHIQSVQAPAGQEQFSTDGNAAEFLVTLSVNPSSQEAQQTVQNVYGARTSLLQNTALQNAEVLVDGQSATLHDQTTLFDQDFIFIITLVSLATFLILMILVRSITAPLYLLATIALSTLSAIGVTYFVYHVILGKDLFSNVPIIAFVFLVSLGEDFNILTIARIREEITKLGHKRGIATAIALTGGVVSSCGLVMAASFFRVASNPVVEFAELGFTVMVGILLDTFVVRPLLVPAITMMLGRWNWVWPHSQLFKRYQEVQLSSRVIANEQSSNPETAFK